jgi:steroid 5-alpha reductase family enzyme
VSFLEAWPLALGGIVVGMTLLWLLSLMLRNASIVDLAWGPGFAAVAVFAAIVGNGYDPRRVLVALLAAVWGLRLGAYIFLRNRGHGEDPRYRAMRRNRGPSFWWFSFLQVFLLQGVLMWIIAMPLVWAASAREPDGIWWTDVVGAIVWAIGFGFEAIGDWQLARFKADPANRGSVMDKGLWRYTRHPNYFGDALLWWGLFIIAAGTSSGLFTIISPIIMTVLLVRVSGVALLERSQVRAKPGYQAYIARTSPLVPWFPRRDKVSHRVA